MGKASNLSHQLHLCRDYGTRQNNFLLKTSIRWHKSVRVETVRSGLQKLLDTYEVDEFIFTCDVYDTAKRLDSFTQLMQVKPGN